MKTTLLASCMISAFALSAQDSYNFSTFIEPYEALQGGTIVDLEEVWDDPYFVIPLGFDFQFAGEVISEVTQIDSGSEFGFFQEGNIINSFGFFSDVADNSPAGGTVSVISYATSGNAGNRICKIDYAMAGFYGVVINLEDATGDNVIDFQIWLYENGSVLELHFGESTISDPDLAYEGEPGPEIRIVIGLDDDNIFDEIDYEIYLSDDPTNPTVNVNTLPNKGDLLGLSSTPASGRVYRFAPDLPTSITEISKDAIAIYPSLAVESIIVKADFSGKKNYQIFDITGKEVMNGLMSDQERIQVSQLHAGVYLFALEGSAKAQKFVKQ